MMTIKEKSENKNLFFLTIEYILAFLLVLDCSSVYALVFPDLFKYIYISFILIAILGKISKRSKNINLGKVIIFAGFYILLLFILYVKAYNQISFVYRFFLIVPLFILNFLLTDHEDESYFSLFYKFSTIVYYLAIVSLFFWFFSSIFSILEPTGQIPFIWGKEQLISHYWGIHFETQYSSSFFSGVYRNSGIFAEAPMYNVCLCIALTFEVFLGKYNNNRHKIIILSIAILSTLTTTGQLFLFMVLFLKIYTIPSKKKIYKLLRIVIIPLVLISSSFVIMTILEEKKKTESYEIRNKDIEKAISEWEKAPIFGGGYGLNVEGNSNSLFALLADGGLSLLFIYLLAILGVPILHYLKFRRSEYLYVSICIFIVFSVTIIVYSLFILSYVAFGLSVLMMKRKNYLNKL